MFCRGSFYLHIDYKSVLYDSLLTMLVFINMENFGHFAFVPDVAQINPFPKRALQGPSASHRLSVRIQCLHMDDFNNSRRNRYHMAILTW